MREPKPPEWEADAELAEKSDGELFRLYLVTKRRALITELRELNDFLGAGQIIIPPGLKKVH